MPNRWQRFRVELIDEDEPLIVQTMGPDYATVVMDPNAPKALDFQFRVVHNALVRTNHEGVPRNYEVFVEKVLGGIPEAVDEEDTELLDPTRQGLSDGPP